MLMGTNSWNIHQATTLIQLNQISEAMSELTMSFQNFPYQAVADQHNQEMPFQLQVYHPNVVLQIAWLQPVNQKYVTLSAFERNKI